MAISFEDVWDYDDYRPMTYTGTGTVGEAAPYVLGGSVQIVPNQYIPNGAILVCYRGGGSQLKSETPTPRKFRAME